MATIVKESGNFRARIRIKGQPTQSATFEKLSEAKRWAHSIEAAIREGRYFKTSESQFHTVAELVDRYIRDVIPDKGSWSVRDQARQLNWWKAELGSWTLADIKPTVIAEARDKLSRGMTKSGKRRTPATVVRYMAALSHAFTLAVEDWGWLDDTPMRKVRKPTEPRGRVRFLSDDERVRLLEECRRSASGDLYCAVVLALSTGARRAEIMSLRWPQVDFGRRCITLFETKNGEIRSLPLVGHAFDLVFERAKNTTSGMLFPGHQNKPIDLRKPFDTALKRADISDFRWHDLRHSCASYLAMNGATLAEIAEVLGHKTLAMVKRYSHLSQAHTTRVVESMNARIFTTA